LLSAEIGAIVKLQNQSALLWFRCPITQLKTPHLLPLQLFLVGILTGDDLFNCQHPRHFNHLQHATLQQCNTATVQHWRTLQYGGGPKSEATKPTINI